MPKSDSGNPFTKYVIPGIQTALGLGSEVVAPGNPIGLGMAGSGIGQLAGGAAGGSQGQGIGGSIGGLGGIFGGGGGGGIPGVSDDAMGSMLESMNPGSGIGDAMVSGGGPAPAAPGLISQLGSGLGSLLQNKDVQGLAGIVTPPKKQQTSPQDINPSRPSGPIPPTISSPPPPGSIVKAPGKSSGGNLSPQQLMQLMRLLGR